MSVALLVTLPRGSRPTTLISVSGDSLPGVPGLLSSLDFWNFFTTTHIRNVVITLIKRKDCILRSVAPCSDINYRHKRLVFYYTTEYTHSSGNWRLEYGKEMHRRWSFGPSVWRPFWHLPGRNHKSVTTA